MTKRHSRSRRSKETPGWMWMLLGLTIGLVVAGYVYISDVRPPRGTVARGTSAPAPAAEPASSTAAQASAPRRETPAAANATAAAQSSARTPAAAQPSTTQRSAAATPAQSSTAQAAQAAQPARSPAAQAAAAQTAAEPAGTRFQFYEDLPQSEVVVPEPSAAPPARSAAATTTAGPAGAAASTAAPAAIQEPGSYMLQVGSFRTHADADRRKASIALLGYESHIQQATVNGDVVHRVLVGPITDLTALDDARRRFRDQNFDTLVLKAAK